LHPGAQIDLDVGGRAGRGQRAQRRAQDLSGLLIQPSRQLIAPVAVPEAQPTAGSRGCLWVTPWQGSTSAAASTRARASPRDTRATARTSPTVDP
jgi:hypothetical protein